MRIESKHLRSLVRFLGQTLVLAILCAPAVCRAQTPLKAYYRDDFILETEDGSFQLRIRGNLHFDTRLYQGEEFGGVQNFDIRRGRIDLRGRIHRRFTFRIQPELAGSPYLRNGWADWEITPGLHVKWGQMKVPFSSSWLTLDNNVNFTERGTAGPIHPFFDRGFLLWGEVAGGLVGYDLGVFTGSGTDRDVSSGDTDSGKEWAGRLLLRPFAGAEGEGPRGLTLALEGTWAGMTTPTDRYETRGFRAANYGTALWRWRTEQVIGTDGRTTDRVAAEVDARHRLGAELHLVRGPLVFSTEILRIRYEDITLHHDLYRGGTRVVHEPIRSRSGSIHSWSTWGSLYLTGESKSLEHSGWRTARPETVFGENGPGALEVLARYSRTWSDPGLFESATVAGFRETSQELPMEYSGPTPGTGNSVSAAVLAGADRVHEVTLGLNWTLNSMVRLQLNDVFLWAPRRDRDGDGANDNFLVSGAFSAQSDPTLKNRLSKWENAVVLRLIFKV